jgi:oleate hydratase
VSGDARGNGGAVTVGDSSWGLSFMLHSKPFYPNQPDDVDLLWGHGLRGNNVGDHVEKRMVDCTGNEILAEFLFHLGLEDRIDDVAAHAKVSLAGMPYITSQFMPRAIGDRPRTVPDGCVNLGFIGQFVEVDGDCVFTVETSVRTAMEAVYGLLQLDKPVIPVSPTRYDIRHLAASIRAVLDIETFHLKDLVQLLAPAALHPPELVELVKLVELVNRIPEPVDVRPGT